MIKKIRKIKTKYIKILFSIMMTFIFLITLLSFSVRAKDSEDYQIMVSMGDSYSSGEGIEPFYGQDENISKRVQNPDWLAHRSQIAWSARLRLPSNELVMGNEESKNKYWYFVAASGAETKHIFNDFKKEYFRDGLSGEYNLAPQITVFDELDAKGLKADYVTLSLGGNDVGFADIIKNAVMDGLAKTGQIAINPATKNPVTKNLATKAYINPNLVRDQINNTWDKVYEPGGVCDRLYESYIAISDRAGPQAQIIVVGYPKLLDVEGSKKFFDENDILLINNAVSNFNTVIENIVYKCKIEDNMNISFVSVEKAFQGHGAYAENAYINPVYVGTKDQDLMTTSAVSSSALKKYLPVMSFYNEKSFSDILDVVSSAYSIHPNNSGAGAYAQYVQNKIDELESLKTGELNTFDTEDEQSVNSKTIDIAETDKRAIVLVLDSSGSMQGTPINETRRASEKFADVIVEEKAKLGIVSYSDNAEIISNFSINNNILKEELSNIYSNGGTNIEVGLKEAKEMLDKSHAKKKIIVLMSDGMPNSGKVGEELIDYAVELRTKERIAIYTLGFFNKLGKKEKIEAQQLMEKIASSGCHYEVANADDLEYVFGDMAYQINGQKYIYIRIACPVDVSVTYNGETLNSSEKDLNTRTDFGTLLFEQNNSAKENEDDRVKVLRLKEGVDYSVKIEGTGHGIMDYTIGFMDENGEYNDLRKFENIKITKKTTVDTVVSVSDKSKLYVDEDGDGKYDLAYEAGVNSYAEEVPIINWFNIALIGGSSAIVIITMSTMILKLKKKYKRGG